MRKSAMQTLRWLGLRQQDPRLEPALPRHQAVRKLTECFSSTPGGSFFTKPKKANKQQVNSHFRARKTEAQKGLVSGGAWLQAGGPDPGQATGSDSEMGVGRSGEVGEADLLDPLSLGVALTHRHPPPPLR